jgi:hypothetical protein
MHFLARSAVMFSMSLPFIFPVAPADGQSDGSVSVTVEETVPLTVTSNNQSVVVMSLGASLPTLGARYRAVRPGDVPVDPTLVAKARWIAENSGSVPGNLDAYGEQESLSAERTAVQVAIREVMKAANPDSTHDPVIGTRVNQILRAIPTSDLGLDSEYSTEYTLTLAAGDEHIATLDLVPTLKSDGDDNSNQLVTVDAVEQPPVARLTDQHGSAIIRVNRPPSMRQYMAHWTASLPPGILLSAGDGQPLLVTAQGLPVSRDSGGVEVSPGSIPHLKDIGFGNAVGDLSSGSTILFAIFVGMIVLLCVSYTPLRSGLDTWRPRVMLVLIAVGVVWIFQIQYPYRPIQAPKLDLTQYGVAQESKIQPNIVKAASSVFKQGSTCFVGALAFDGDPNTAWVSGRGLGSGALLGVDVGQPSWLVGIRLRNGFPGQYYSTNGRVRDLQIVTDGGFVQALRVKDTPDWQQLTLEHPILTQNIVFRVVSQSSGFRSSAISELELLGYQSVTQTDRNRSRDEQNLAIAPGFSSLSTSETATCR